MKNINYVVNGVLAIAVIILFVMQFSKPKKADSSAPITVKEGTNKLPIAYVNVDSLLLNYNYSKDLNELILKKYENTRASLNQKANSLQSDAIDFQKKVENNAFLTNERAQQEHQRILKKRDELEKAQKELDDAKDLYWQGMDEYEQGKTEFTTAKMPKTLVK